MQTLVLSYAVVCIFGAAVVRGYSGFGFSLLAITSLSLLLPPTQIVPSIFIMEVAASLHLLPSVWRDIHWVELEGIEVHGQAPFQGRPSLRRRSIPLSTRSGVIGRSVNRTPSAS